MVFICFSTVIVGKIKNKVNKDMKSTAKVIPKQINFIRKLLLLAVKGSFTILSSTLRLKISNKT